MPEFSYVGLAALEAKARTALEVAVTEAANDLVRRAQATVTVRTGTLRASIQTSGAVSAGDGATARVFTGAESSAYAVFVHEGTGPHRIEPVNGKALAFNGIVVKYVNHPGTRAQRYLSRPLTAMTPAYVKYIQSAVDAAF